MLTIIINVLLVAVGLAMLFAGSEFLIRGSVKIAKRMHISQLVIGLTVVAFGTSTPELVVSINSALEGQAYISLGNIIGSNIFNVLSILGISSLIIGIKVNFTIFIDYVVMMGFSAALIPVMKSGFIITKKEGYILVTVYLLYLGFLIMTIY